MLGALPWPLVSSGTRPLQATWILYGCLGYVRLSTSLADMQSGSKQNWRSLAKAFAQKLGMPVYSIVRPRDSCANATLVDGRIRSIHRALLMLMSRISVIMVAPRTRNRTPTPQWLPISTISSANSISKASTYSDIACELSLLSQGICREECSRILIRRLRGGKAVMAFALHSGFNQHLRSLISVDMSPAVGRISPE